MRWDLYFRERQRPNYVRRVVSVYRQGERLDLSAPESAEHQAFKARIARVRDQNAGEVDLVLETPDGRVAGIEVKARATPSRKDFKGLSFLREKLGKRFIAGVVLHTGTTGGSFGDRLAAAPMDALWVT